MSDHHDFGLGDDHLPDDHVPDDHLPAWEDPFGVHDDGHEVDGGHDFPGGYGEHEPYEIEENHGVPEGYDEPDLADLGPAEESATAADDVIDVFPPALDVELPEPVDGFPWIDSALLGSTDALQDAPLHAVTAGELAAYAGEDLPDGADTWQRLAESDDPATAALARWWQHH